MYVVKYIPLKLIFKLSMYIQATLTRLIPLYIYMLSICLSSTSITIPEEEALNLRTFC